MKKNCWLCGEIKLTCVKTADVPSTVDAAAFRVTDANYGQCAAVYQCTACGFRQCSDFSDVLSFYQAMDDPGYEASRAPRALQAERLLQSVSGYRPGGRATEPFRFTGHRVPARIVEAASFLTLTCLFADPQALH